MSKISSVSKFIKILLLLVGIMQLSVYVVLFLRFSGLSNSLPIIVNFGSTELRYLLLGLIIYVVSWVMSTGLALQQDQELVI